jgi:hypothetical protein
MKYWVRSHVLVQRFSTWGMQADHRGYAKRPYGQNDLFWSTQRGYNSYLGIHRWVQFLFGGTQKGTISIWGYTEGYNFNLGVPE